MFGKLFPAGGGLPIPLLKEQVIVGRSSSCDVVVPSTRVSRRHCLLKLRDGYWWVKDLESRGGTGINGKRVSQSRILPRQILCVPRMRFRIEYSIPSDKPQMSDDSLAMTALSEDVIETAPDRSTSESVAPQPSAPPRTADTRSKPAPAPAPASSRGDVPEQGGKPSDSSRAGRLLGKLTPVGGGTPIPLLIPKIIVGRSKSSDIVLRVATVSSRHCSLEWEDGYWFVEDLGSSNGIRVNGEKVERRILMPGDKLAVSKRRFVIDYTPVGEPPRDMSVISKSLLEKAGLQNAMDSDEAPTWITSHEVHDDENKRVRYRLDETDD